MRFYTNVCRIGNELCVREINETGQSKYKRRFTPTMYLQNNEGSEFTSLYGDSVKPLTLDNMKEAREFLERYKGVTGVNVFGQQNWILQFLNDEYGGVLPFDPKLISAWAIDIETKLPVDENGAVTGFPDVETANAEIVLITLQNLTSKQCFTFGSREYKGTKKLESSYLNCGSEIQLFKQFIEFWQQKGIEVVTGWNIERFDIPYIFNRILRVLDLTWAGKLSPWNNVQTSRKKISGGFGDKEELVIDIAGVSILDYMALYKKYVFTKHESYSLGHIAQEELGQTKLDHSEYKNFNEFYEKGFDEKFVEYNIIDTQLVSRLEDKLKLIQLVYTVAYLAKVNFNDVFSPVKTWDAIIHNRLLGENVVVPLRGKNDGEDRSIEGAYIMEPVNGFHNWVVSLDATSLYPSIMMSLNISPETYLGRDHDINFVKVLTGEQKLVSDDNVTSPLGTKFSRNTRGVMPKIIEEYMGNRKSAKRTMLNEEQKLEYIKAEIETRKKARL